MDRNEQATPVLPAGWIEPVESLFAEIETILAETSEDLLLPRLELAVAAMPALISEMDVEALADALEAGMGRAAVAGALTAPVRRLPAAGHAFSAEAFENVAMRLGIGLGPLPEAVAKLGRRTPVGARLSSAEWRRVPLALRERAQFSARVESMRFLSAVQEKLRRRLAWETEAVANGQALVDRSSFIADLRQIAIEEGIETTGPEGRGTVRDIRGAKRLGLIYDMQTRQAAEFARAKMDMDPDVLDEFPAYRFERVESRERERGDWPARWEAAASQVGYAGVARGEMVALKTSPVWAALSAFGTPWPPYDFGSGMGRTDVDRAEAEALGLVRPGERPAPLSLDLNDGLEASAADIDSYGLEQIKAFFGDQILIDAGRIAWRGLTV